MSSLEKFAKFANPDKLLMVGEVRFLLSHLESGVVANGCDRHWWAPILLLKQGTSMLHLVPLEGWMGLLYPSVTPLGIW